MFIQGCPPASRRSSQARPKRFEDCASATRTMAGVRMRTSCPTTTPSFAAAAAYALIRRRPPEMHGSSPSSPPCWCSPTSSRSPGSSPICATSPQPAGPRRDRRAPASSAPSQPISAAAFRLVKITGPPRNGLEPLRPPSGPGRALRESLTASKPWVWRGRPPRRSRRSSAGRTQPAPVLHPG